MNVLCNALSSGCTFCKPTVACAAPEKPTDLRVWSSYHHSSTAASHTSGNLKHHILCIQQSWRYLNQPTKIDNSWQ